jgi:hypothetical protein
LGPVVVEHLGGDDLSCRGIVDNEVLEPGLAPTQQFVVAQGLAGGVIAGDEPDAAVGLDDRGHGAYLRKKTPRIAPERRVGEVAGGVAGECR